MYSSVIFDTLAYSKRLKAAGFTEKQAEVQAEVLAEIVNENLATKRDLKEMEMRLTIKLGASIAIIATIVKFL